MIGKSSFGSVAWEILLLDVVIPVCTRLLDFILCFLPRGRDLELVLRN